MGKFWSLVFGFVVVACGLLCLAAPSMGYGLPPAVSAHAKSIDDLFYIILWVTTFFYVLTQLLLVCFMWRYGSGADGKRPELKPSLTSKVMKPLTGYLNTPHKIEMAWTIVPAVILLYIAFAQVPTWASVKYFSRMPKHGGDSPLQIEVSARQFEWRMRYPNAERSQSWLDGKDEGTFKSFAKSPQYDDVHQVNELHVVKNHAVLVHLSTRDVLHSFNLPNMRVKQDALPGKTIPVWFTPTKSNTAFNPQSKRWEDGFNPDTQSFLDEKQVWDIACAELCGWGHYRMIGRVFVHETKEDFLDWLGKAQAQEKMR